MERQKYLFNTNNSILGREREAHRAEGREILLKTWCLNKYKGEKKPEMPVFITKIGYNFYFSQLKPI